MTATRITTALLDIDGTLLDSNDAHADAWVEVLQRHGRPVAWDRIRADIGKGSDKLLSERVDLDEEDPLAQTLVAERRQWFVEERLPSLRPTPGARELVQRLLSQGLRVVVATSAGADELHGLLRQADVDDLIQTATTSSDAAASKPDPDIIVAALKKAGVSAAEALMVGDTPYDIEAAQRAGVATIALRCGGGWDDAALAGAVAIYDHPAALLADWDQSPFADRDADGRG